MEKIERSGRYKGFSWVVLAASAWRCGYVKIPKGHKYYEATVGGDYDSIPVNCHGGLTFAGGLKTVGKSGAWIGFDCIHLGDAYDPKLAEENNVGHIYTGLLDGVVRDADYVENECKNIIDQLVARSNLKK